VIHLLGDIRTVDIMGSGYSYYLDIGVLSGIIAWNSVGKNIRNMPIGGSMWCYYYIMLSEVYIRGGYYAW